MRVRGSADPAAVVLVLHGGMEHSHEPSERTHLASMRMKPFARALHRQGLTVWRVRYRVRGWNGEQRSPVQDARWALDEVRRRHGDVPVVLLGHSMGGRAAAHVLTDPAVVGLVALCPWLPSEPTSGAVGKRLVVAHALDDTTTNPAQSLAWASAAAEVALSTHYIGVRDSNHGMTRRFRLWHRLAATSVAGILAGDGSAGLLRSEV
ncbi:MAG: alpha/beta hydrolase [Frankiales bacterium]|nr:alpha/beta hydrolase [Frankiales bacterium]